MSVKSPSVIAPEEMVQCVEAVIKCYQENNQERILVAVAGRPGSGKSTFAEILANEIRGAAADILSHSSDASEADKRDAMGLKEVCVMAMDGYHMYRSELRAMPNAEEAIARRGAEWTFNPSKMLSDLRALRHTEVPGLTTYRDYRVPSFDHGVGDPVEQDIIIPATAKIIIVEGNYVCYDGTPEWKRVTKMFNLRIFLSCDPQVCARRLCDRHMAAWNISEAEAMRRATGSDATNGDLVDTTAKNAHLCVRSIARSSPRRSKL